MSGWAQRYAEEREDELAAIEEMRSEFVAMRAEIERLKAAIASQEEATDRFIDQQVDRFKAEIERLKAAGMVLAKRTRADLGWFEDIGQDEDRACRVFEDANAKD